MRLEVISWICRARVGEPGSRQDATRRSARRCRPGTWGRSPRPRAPVPGGQSGGRMRSRAGAIRRSGHPPRGWGRRRWGCAAPRRAARVPRRQESTGCRWRVSPTGAGASRLPGGWWHGRAHGNGRRLPMKRCNSQREELNSRRVADMGPDTTRESRHSVALFRCFSTVGSDIVERQVRQIVQS